MDAYKNYSLLTRFANGVSGGYIGVIFFGKGGMGGRDVFFVSYSPWERSICEFVSGNATQCLMPCVILTTTLLDMIGYVILLMNVHSEIWCFTIFSFSVCQHGAFSESHWDSLPIAVSPPGGSIAGAVAATVVLQPHEKKTVTFTLVWDSPKVKFLKGRSYYR